MPKLANAFEFKAEILSPLPNSFGIAGFINETVEYYDYKDQIFVTDNTVYNSLVREVHDFVTGLKFRLHKNSGNCSISKIDPNGEDAEVNKDGQLIIRNPKHFFDFSTHNYQYTGQVN